MTEHQPFDVVRRYDGFEVRRYPAHVLAQVDVRGGLEAGAGAGFGPLFRYISGGNASGTSIAMTAPVLQQTAAPGLQTVSFVMPADMTPASTPTPREPRVRTVAVGPRLMAARRFSGAARTARFSEQGARLLAAVRSAGLTPVGEVAYARFDPPWTPGFLRHNEALVELVDPPPSD
jgi:hypothetical protein